MHSLEVIESRNVDAVRKAMREALADDTVSGYLQARMIARANLDLFYHDGRVQTAALFSEDRELLHVEVQG